MLARDRADGWIRPCALPVRRPAARRHAPLAHAALQTAL